MPAAHHALPAKWIPPAASQLTRIPGVVVQSYLGCGGMGAVYTARQVGSGNPVAVKIARPAKGRSKTFQALVIHEAQVMAKLDHQHIVKVHDFGVTDDLVWVVMELVEGPTLRQRLRSHRISPDLALALSQQLCEALIHAHSRGVIHQDLKPDNVLIGRDHQVKIIDFGLSLVQDFSYTVARPGRTAGTPYYMAPEQRLLPHYCDHRIDLYALGVILFEMLTGRLPKGADPLPPQYGSGSDQISGIIRKCMQHNPNDRWQSAADLLKALRGIAHDDPLLAQSAAPTDILACDSSFPEDSPTSTASASASASASA